MLLHKAIATVFGLGMAPFAPGTFGALGAVLLFILSAYLGFNISTPALLVCIILITLLGVWSTQVVIPEWGDDPSRVVIDEFVGIMITMVLVPVSIKSVLIGFVLFRFFDIAKPLGVRTIDKKIKGAWGVMLDDVLAGVYSCICMHLIIQFSPIL